MPTKLPVQTGPQVAPNVVNLPGARRVYAGEGLTALGGAITKAAADVQTVINRKEDEEDDRLEDERVRQFQQDIVNWKVRPADKTPAGELPKFRDWAGPKGDRSGLAQTYIDAATKKLAKYSEGLTPKQAARFSKKVDPHRLNFISALEQEESASIEKAWVADRAAKLEMTTTEAASDISLVEKTDLIAKDGTNMSGVFIATHSDSAPVEALARELAARQRFGPPATERFVQESLNLHYARLAQGMLNNKNIPKEVVSAYVENLSRSAYTGTDGKEHARLDPTHPVTRQVVEELNGQRRAEKVAIAESAALKASGGSALQASIALRAKVSAKDTSPEDVEIGLLAADQLQASHTKAKASVLLEEESARAAMFVTMRTAKANKRPYQSLASVMVNLDGKVIKATSLSLESQKLLSEQLSAADDVEGAAPRGVKSEAGKAAWTFLATLNEEQRGKYQSTDNPLYTNVPVSEVPVLIDVASKAASELGQESAQLRNRLADHVRLAAKNKRGATEQDVDRAARAFNLRWDQMVVAGRKVSDSEANAVLLSTLAEVDSGVFGGKPAYRKMDEPVAATAVAPMLEALGIDLKTWRPTAQAYAGIRPKYTGRAYFNVETGKVEMIDDKNVAAVREAYRAAGTPFILFNDGELE
jgi:hypothetical protein